MHIRRASDAHPEDIPRTSGRHPMDIRRAPGLSLESEHPID